MSVQVSGLYNRVAFSFGERNFPSLKLLYELLGDEESSQVKQLPCGQTKQAQNGKNTEIQHTGIG